MDIGKYLLVQTRTVLHIIQEFFIYVGDNIFPAKCTSNAKLHNKTVVITGGNTGIGKETALDLAGRGAKVIIACRDTIKGKRAAEDIRKQIPDANVCVKQLDLASFTSIGKFAAEILDTEPRIHILINNAGVMACPKTQTVDGFETHLGVNHLGHFLLTNLLLDRIKASAPARIVTVSSFLYAVGRIRFDDINLDRGYNRLLAYTNTKLANILFTRELAKILEGTGVTTYCVHPGVINTEISRHFKSFAFGIAGFFWDIIFEKILNKTPKQGAQASIFCSVDEEIANETGLYYCACKSVNPIGKAKDDECSKALWKLSEDLINSRLPDVFPSKDSSLFKIQK